MAARPLETIIINNVNPHVANIAGRIIWRSLNSALGPYVDPANNFMRDRNVVPACSYEEHEYNKLWII